MKTKVVYCLKIFVWILILSAIFLGDKATKSLEIILFGIIFPSLIISWFVGLIIEKFGGNVLREYYLTIEIGGIKLSLTLFTISIIIIKFLIF